MTRSLGYAAVSSVRSHVVLGASAMFMLLATACDVHPDSLSDGRTSFVIDAQVANPDATHSSTDAAVFDATAPTADAQANAADAGNVAVDAIIAAADALRPVDGNTAVDATAPHADASSVDARVVAPPDAASSVDARIVAPPDAASVDAHLTSVDAHPATPDAHGGSSVDARTNVADADTTPDAIPPLFAGGDGTPGNPFLIANSRELTDATDPTYANSSFRVIADIDLVGVTFVPFDTFNGTFDGNHHRISNWTFSGNDCVGFFDNLYGLVSDVVLVNPTVSGTQSAYVGALVGCNSGEVVRDQTIGGQITSDYMGGGVVGIQNPYGAITGVASSFASATITAPYAGGVVGYSNAQILDSYSTGEISNSGYGGGLVGYDQNTVVLRSYASGSVDSTTSQPAGLIGIGGDDTDILDSFWDIDTTGQTTSSGGTGLSAAQMIDPSNFADWDLTSTWQMTDGSAPTLRASGNVAPMTLASSATAVGATPIAITLNAFDFNGDTLIYSIVTPPSRGTLSAITGNQVTYTADGWTGYSDSMTYQVTDSHGVTSPITTIGISVQSACNQADPGFADGGDGSAATPYVVRTIAELQLVHEYMFCNYVLNNDIDLSGVSFSPIGSSTSFSSTFEGNNHQIKNWTYASHDGTDAGFFANMSGTVQDLALVNVNVSGTGYVGGLAAEASGTLTNDFTSGTVTSTGDSAGGLAANSYATVTSCGSSATVSSTNESGGLIGFQSSYGISNSFASGDVTSTGTDSNSAAGGLIGYSQFSGVEASYATGGVVAAAAFAGGLVGYDQFLVNGYSDVSDCYATGSASGGLAAGGLIGFANVEETGTLARDYAVGAVFNASGSADLGGLVGLEQDQGDPGDFTATDAFWDVDTTLQATTAGAGAAESDTAMQSQATYTDFDFATVWTMSPPNYPTLRLGQ